MHISVYAQDSIKMTSETSFSGENLGKSGAGFHSHVTYWFSNDPSSSFRIKGGPSAECLFLDPNNYMYALILRLSLGYARHHKIKKIDCEPLFQLVTTSYMSHSPVNGYAESRETSTTFDKI